jgi:hypothetical protein
MVFVIIDTYSDQLHLEMTLANSTKNSGLVETFFKADA